MLEAVVPEQLELAQLAALVAAGLVHQVLLHPLAETVLSILAEEAAEVSGQTLDHQVLAAQVW